MRIENIDEAIDLFKKHAIIQCEATEEGNYKMGNKSYDIIIRCISFIANNSMLEKLSFLLKDNNTYLRFWAPCALLHTEEKEAIKVLKDIKRNETGFISLNAEITLSELEKGNLKKDYLIKQKK